jgi:hypothetical protein
LGPAPEPGAGVFDEQHHGVLRDLLKDMRQLAEAIRKDVRERLADIERSAVNLATKIRALKEDRKFVRKQLAALDEQENTSTSKRVRHHPANPLVCLSSWDILSLCFRLHLRCCSLSCCVCLAGLSVSRGGGAVFVSMPVV